MKRFSSAIRASIQAQERNTSTLECIVHKQKQSSVEIFIGWFFFCSRILLSTFQSRHSCRFEEQKSFAALESGSFACSRMLKSGVISFRKESNSKFFLCLLAYQECSKHTRTSKAVKLRLFLSAFWVSPNSFPPSLDAMEFVPCKSKPHISWTLKKSWIYLNNPAKLEQSYLS